MLTEEKVDYKTISPASASEYIAKTFLPSVISGLRYAPKIFFNSALIAQHSALNFQNIESVFVPFNGFGSPGVFFMSEKFKNVFLVRENNTLLDVKVEDINNNFKIIDSYKELVLNRDFKDSCINLDVLKRPLDRIREI